jgi:hypothetical protein
MFSVSLDPFSKVVLDRSIKAGMVIQKAVFKMKVVPVDAQFSGSIFSGSSAKGCSGLIYQSRNGYSNSLFYDEDCEL